MAVKPAQTLLRAYAYLFVAYLIVPLGVMCGAAFNDSAMEWVYLALVHRTL
ncbi:MAG: hypothetical protein ABJA10_04165 [Aestuariivirga sp.]